MRALYRLIVLAILAATLWACSDNSPAVPLTGVADVCQQDADTKVAVDGRLALPLSLICRSGQCQINFYDDTASVLIEFVASEELRANGLQLPPQQYTDDDLRVGLADGTAADRNTLVKVTGVVKRPSASACYLDVYTVERP